MHHRQMSTTTLTTAVRRKNALVAFGIVAVRSPEDEFHMFLVSSGLTWTRCWIWLIESQFWHPFIYRAVMRFSVIHIIRCRRQMSSPRMSTCLKLLLNSREKSSSRKRRNLLKRNNKNTIMWYQRQSFAPSDDRCILFDNSSIRPKSSIPDLMLKCLPRSSHQRNAFSWSIALWLPRARLRCSSTFLRSTGLHVPS